MNSKIYPQIYYIDTKCKLCGKFQGKIALLDAEVKYKHLLDKAVIRAESHICNDCNQGES